MGETQAKTYTTESTCKELLETMVDERDAARSGIMDAHEILDDAGVARAECDEKVSPIGEIHTTRFFTVTERIMLLLNSFRRSPKRLEGSSDAEVVR